MDGKIFELQMQIKDTEKSINDYQSKIECHRKEKEKAEKEMHKLLCETCSAYNKIYGMYIQETNRGYNGSLEKKMLMEDMLGSLKHWLMNEYNPNLFVKK
jgi:hypothetical protein